MLSFTGSLPELAGDCLDQLRLSLPFDALECLAFLIVFISRRP